jgi:uncharacterized RDD family membrane protein YckC
METSGIATLQPSSKSKQTYLLVINGKPEGPFNMAQLKDLNIRSVDFVKTASMDDYKEAHEVAELRELLGFKQEPVIPQYFGSFDQRLLASALDLFFVSAACAVVTLIIAIIVGDKVLRMAIAFSLFASIPLTNLVYHAIMESSAKQATIGKQILKIKVCDMQGYRVTTGHAIGRNMAKIISVCTFFIGYLFAFFNKKQQCLHDMVAGTLVIKDRLF